MWRRTKETYFLLPFVVFHRNWLENRGPSLRSKQYTEKELELAFLLHYIDQTIIHFDCTEIYYAFLISFCFSNLTSL